MSFLSRTAALGVLFVSAYAVADGSTGAGEHQTREVLPNGVTPVHYDLTISPDAETLTFEGKVGITIDVGGATRRVVLNAVGLTFDRAVLDGARPAAVSIDATAGRASLEFEAAIAPGRHLISIDYHGSIGRTTVGFFAMDYSSAAGKSRTLATNFEPAAARELLPCWDEPGRKATFILSVDTPKDRMAVSNMPIEQVASLSATTQRVRFRETPKMSTYLLFLGIGDFERVGRTVDGVDVGIIVKRGDLAKAAYALDQAGKLLHYYDDYFKVRFPLPKLDLIAAPGQIVGGSMENWGAIFYSQNHLLFDPDKSTEADRQEVFTVVSHEMAHQWFGDLVTMSWWDDLWLNEGFARWMQTFAADDLHPEWETGLQAAALFEQGKQTDSLVSTHAVVQRIHTVEQAQQSFDAITYSKGAAVIAMINAYVGRDRFCDGVRRYMQAHAFGNTVSGDLWTAVQASAGKPILGIAQDFTHQEGLPLTRVARSARGIVLTQARFADDQATLRDIAPQHWRLPLAIGAVDGPKRYILTPGTMPLARDATPLVNAGQSGYTRVLYTDALAEALTARFAALSPIDQLGLLDDALVLGIAGYAPTSNVLALAAALPPNADPIVWRRVIAMLKRIDSDYGDSPSRSAYRRFILELSAPLATLLRESAATDQSSNRVILESDLALLRGQSGDSAVIDGARAAFESGTGTPAERRNALAIVAMHADTATFDGLLARAKSTADPLEKERIFEALANVDDPSLAGRLVDISLTDAVPAGMAPRLITALSAKHPDTVWTMLAPRLDDPALPIDKLTRWTLARVAAANSADIARVADLTAYEAHSVPVEARKPSLQAIASIHQNVRIKNDVLPELDRWIEKHR